MIHNLPPSHDDRDLTFADLAAKDVQDIPLPGAVIGADMLQGGETLPVPEATTRQMGATGLVGEELNRP